MNRTFYESLSWGAPTATSLCLPYWQHLFWAKYIQLYLLPLKIYLTCERDPGALPRCEFASLLLSKSWVVQEGRPGSPRSLQAPQAWRYSVQHLPSRLGSSSQIAQVTKRDSKAGFFQNKTKVYSKAEVPKKFRSHLNVTIFSLQVRLNFALCC